MIPTKILAPPFKEKVSDGYQSRVTMMLVTDAGILSMREAASLVGMAPATLQSRLYANNHQGWRNQNIFGREHQQAVFVDIENPEPLQIFGGSYLPKRGIRRQPETIHMGSFEVKSTISDCDHDSYAKSICNRDIAYAEALRHHRSVCR